MKARHSAVAILVCLGVLALAFQAGAAEWKPAKPITAIVPWPAGGATDLTVRILASEMEKVLGQRISVVKHAGGSGAIGMQNALRRAQGRVHLTGNADVSIVNYPVLDLMKITHRDWIHWYALMTPNIIATTMDYPAKDVADLVRIMKEKPGQVAVASAGLDPPVNLPWRSSRAPRGPRPACALRGREPAVIATISGESNVVMQLSMEEADMIRAKKLKPLANSSNRTLMISGYGEVPPITKWFPELPVHRSHFRIMVAKGTPPDAVAAISKAFDVAAKSEALKKFADEKAVLPGQPQGRPRP